MKRPSRSEKRYKNDDDRPYFKRGEPVEVTRDFIENIGDPDFPRYGWIVKKSRPLMSDPGYEYLIERDPEFAADDGYDKSYWVYDTEIRKGRYNEGFMSNIGKDVQLGEKGEYLKSSRKLVKEAGRKVIPAANGCSIHDMGDCWIVTNKDGLNIGQCRTLIEAEDIAENADEYTTKKLGYAESRKLVKEGAGAGYDVGISDLEIDKVTEVKELDDGDYSFTATIKPGNYEISAESYYDDFFWQEHEWGDTPQAQIDGGVIHGTISPWEDTDDPEEWVRYQVEGNTFNLSFMYGGGWMHSNLPEDGQLYIDEHITITPELYFSIDDIQLDAIDLVQAVNGGYASLDDRYEDEQEDEDGEPMDESYDPNKDDGRKRIMNALEEFRQVLWDDTKVDDKDEHDLRRSLFQDVDDKISQAIQKYFKYSRM